MAIPLQTFFAANPIFDMIVSKNGQQPFSSANGRVGCLAESFRGPAVETRCSPRGFRFNQSSIENNEK